MDTVNAYATFLRARWDEQEREARGIADAIASDDGAFASVVHDHPELAAGDCPSWLADYDPASTLADLEAKRKILAWHESWPVLTEGPIEFEQVDLGGTINSIAIQTARQAAWLTEREYVKHFGAAPPTSPILEMLAEPFREHPDHPANVRHSEGD